MPEELLLELEVLLKEEEPDELLPLLSELEEPPEEAEDSG
jgi:hypothetical protein